MGLKTLESTVTYRPRALVSALLDLNDCDIATALEKDDLVLGVQGMDLAKNKLNDCAEVFGVLKPMPRIKFVNI